MGFYETLRYYAYDARDTRLQHLFLMGPYSLLQVIVIVAAYMYFIKSLGLKLMANRRPMNLKNVLIVYNIGQILANLWLGTVATYGVITRHDYKCIKVDFSNHPIAIWEAKLAYTYYMLKLIDLLDTVFFVLRKKQNQLSFLHIYHHAFMFLACHFHVSYMPAGHMGAIGILNCYVHVLMYTYYLVSSMKSKMATIWWKKLITLVQMTQFVILLVHFTHPFIYGNCPYSRGWLFAGALQSAFFLGMFTNFYYNAYCKKSKIK